MDNQLISEIAGYAAMWLRAESHTVSRWGPHVVMSFFIKGFRDTRLWFEEEDITSWDGKTVDEVVGYIVSAVRRESRWLGRFS